MNEHEAGPVTPLLVDVRGAAPVVVPEAGGVISGLAMLAPGTIVDERALAAMFKVTPRTVRRMARRGELPPPVRLAGRACWLVGRVLAHIEAEAERGARDARKQAEKIARFSA